MDEKKPLPPYSEVDPEKGITSELQASNKDSEALVPLSAPGPESPKDETAAAEKGKEEEDAEEKKEDDDIANYKLSYFQLYRFADSTDRMLMIIGTVCAIANGISQPIMTIVFGNLINSLLTYGLCTPADYLAGKTYCVYPDSNERLNRDVRQSVIYLTIIGSAVAAASYFQMALWLLTGERQAKRIREEYLKAVLRQNVAWFDKNQTGDITTRLTADILTIQEGISEKAGGVFQQVAAFLAGFVIAFTKGWKLALVLCSVFPLLAGVGTLMSRTINARQGKGSDSYGEAGAIAQEVLSSIRTVTAFGGEKREVERYKKKLEEGEKNGIKISLINGASVGTVMCVIFGTYSLGFWYGGSLIGNGPGDLTGGDVLNVFFSIIIGAFSLGQAGPNVAAMGSALGAAKKIFSTLDRVSPIDAFSEEGEKPENVEGSIEFHDIDFHYPQRPDVPILKKFSLTVKPAQTVALVGASGSGKSTIVKLLERFYDPVSGSVTLDGHDIKELNVAWLRDQIGFVGQEPVLFDLTVRQNLLFGLPSSFVNTMTADELEKKVIAALKTANAWGFVQNLPDGLDTAVGEAGGMMSGGQKQRLAIARAIMREPKILLLDEATSALDTESERIVQAALDNAAANRTTIVIAHRLSTIKNADLIVVMDRGEIIETGRHNDLLELDGVYASLVKVQALRETDSPSPIPKAALPEIAPEDVKIDALVSADDLALSKAVEAKRASVIVEDSADVKINVGDVEMKVISTDDVMTLERPKRKKSIVGDAKDEAQKKKEAEAELLKTKLPWARLYKINSAEWPYFIVGVLASGGNGVLFPMFSNIFSEVLNVFGKVDANERNSGIRFWALMFVLLAVGAFFSNFLSIAAFGTAGERLTKRIRFLTFSHLMRQDISFFDEDKHSTGALTARLAEDANLIQGLTGRLMGSIVQTFVTMLTGLLIAFINGWELTLVVLAAVPFIGIAGAMQIKAMTGFGAKTKEAYNEASEIANEAIDQIRTVATLGKEKRFWERYRKDIAAPHAFAVRGAFASAVGFAISQGFIFFAYALAFYAGSQFVILGRMGTKNVFTVMFAVIFTAISAGQASSFAPNYVQAKLAALSVFSLLDRESKIDPENEFGTTGEGEKGKVEVVDAVFRYPSRPDVPVLNGLNLSAAPGKTVALVGASGCGKSTVIAILERWYDLLGGKALLSDLEVKQWRLKSLREEMALVGQEPVLFNLSVRENIQYGSTLGTASQEEIEAAAKMANIHDFVTSLPEGYNTIVGSKGGQLSGGQKQRVAIARALIRNPKLLLLDEATSALDSESERVVQEALDAAAKGRTTIVIAHRLATIQSADHIVVIDKGVVVEQGKFEDLVRLGGKFAELAAAQSLAKTEE
ncbi:ATP-binding cassette, sub-B (MDR TAP), member 4 [Phlyctochytrium planicorne]|nr:ATP-binding cassette, sub-B (MDR TAP), member 4 [Phlyctochytrium planicorne]